MRDIKTYCGALKQAVNQELSRKKSYGCVNYWSTGSHTDMNYKLILKSLDSIIFDLGHASWPLISSFADLRSLGQTMEKNMFRATDGVNTYKGLIFLQLFLVFTWIKGVSWEESPEFIKELATPLLADYKLVSKAKYYQGESLEDIRHFPLSGFKKVFEMVDSLLKEPLSDDLLTLRLIASIDDTTSVARSSVARMRELQEIASSAVEAYEAEDFDTYEKLSEALNHAYLSEFISSGGVADLFTTIRTLEILRRNNDY